jgi:hypothetical protein
MTRALPFTQASLQCAIKAARKAGLNVTGIRPDGTLIVNAGDKSIDAVVPLVSDGQPREPSKWEDAEA